MKTEPQLSCAHDIEWEYGCHDITYESVELRVIYNHFPAVQGGLEEEPEREYFEVEEIIPIYCDDPVIDARAAIMAEIAMKMHEGNPDQLISTLENLDGF